MPRLSAVEQQQFDAAQMRDVIQQQERLQIMRAALQSIATLCGDTVIGDDAREAIKAADAVHARHREDTDAMIALEACGGCINMFSLAPATNLVYERLADARKIDRVDGKYFSKNFTALQRALAKKHF